MPPHRQGRRGGLLVNAYNVRNAHVQIVDEESAYSSMADRSNYDLHNILSTRDLRDCRNVERHPYSIPIHDQ